MKNSKVLNKSVNQINNSIKNFILQYNLKVVYQKDKQIVMQEKSSSPYSYNYFINIKTESNGENVLEVNATTASTLLFDVTSKKENFYQTIKYVLNN